MACGFVAAAAVKAAPHTPRTLCAHRFDALQEEVVAAALHGVPMAEEEEQVQVQEEEEEVSAATRLELDRLAELELLEVELDGLLRRSAAPAAALPPRNAALAPPPVVAWVDGLPPHHDLLVRVAMRWR